MSVDLKTLQREIDDVRRVALNTGKNSYYSTEATKAQQIEKGTLIFDINGSDFRFRNKALGTSVQLDSQSREFSNMHAIKFDDGSVLLGSHKHDDDYAPKVHEHKEYALTGHNHDDK